MNLIFAVSDDVWITLITQLGLAIGGLLAYLRLKVRVNETNEAVKETNAAVGPKMDELIVKTNDAALAVGEKAGIAKALMVTESKAGVAAAAIVAEAQVQKEELIADALVAREELADAALKRLSSESNR